MELYAGEDLLVTDETMINDPVLVSDDDGESEMLVGGGAPCFRKLGYVEERSDYAASADKSCDHVPKATSGVICPYFSVYRARFASASHLAGPPGR